MERQPARVRIGKVRPKRGGVLELLRVPVDARRKLTDDLLRQTLDAHGHISGFALVVWDAEAGSSCCMHIMPDSTIPSIVIGDFVRNRLLAQRIISWTIEDINAQWGFK